ncbi:MAG: hypothetical protein C3F07_04865 [Anaerolineales bacterium]|nr:MAG: hypothetical protein C3F07_04865 [Anaerolineales bacterium]
MTNRLVQTARINKRRAHGQPGGLCMDRIPETLRRINDGRSKGTSASKAVASFLCMGLWHVFITKGVILPRLEMRQGRKISIR